MNGILVRNRFENELPYLLFYVNSCGYILDKNYTSEHNFPEGKDDYQLIYVTKGQLYAIVGGEKKYYHKDTVLIYKPGDMQIYGNKDKDAVSYFWVHFNGDIAQELLEAAGLWKGFDHQVVSSDFDLEFIKKMALSITHKIAGYQLKLLSLFTELLSRISYRMETKNEYRNIYKRLLPALSDIEHNLSKKRSIAEYASMCAMSEFYFLHKFKEFMHMTPGNYRNYIMMKNAGSLLEETNMAVCEIAYSSGFKDALYFTKKFKKFYGVSPSDYRKQKTQRAKQK